MRLQDGFNPLCQLASGHTERGGEPEHPRNPGGVSEDRRGDGRRVEVAVGLEEYFPLRGPGLGRGVRNGTDPNERDPLMHRCLGKVRTLHVDGQDVEIRSLLMEFCSWGDNLIDCEEGSDVEGETEGLQRAGYGFQKEGVRRKGRGTSDHMRRDDKIAEYQLRSNASTEAG